MSDGTRLLPDFLGNGADEELMFDEPIVNVAPPVAADTESSKPRRMARRGRKSTDGDASPESIPVATMPTLSAEAGSATAEEPAGAPAPFPPLGADPAGSKLQPWLLAIVAFAMLTSLISLGGLIAVGRTLAHAGADRAQAADERQALAGIPTLVAHLDAASARLDSAGARIAPASPVFAAGAAGPAITMTDLHHELDALKLALGQRQPEGLTSLNDITRDGFSEMTTKLDRLSAQIDQMNRHGSAVSASRPASRAADPRRPS